MREEEKNRSSQVNKFFKKRWVFPAIYLVSAALLISLIVYFQTNGMNTAKGPDKAKPNDNVTGKTEEPVIEVNTSFEHIAMPVQNKDEVEVVTEFYDAAASEEKQEAALIVDGNSYRPSMGVDISHKDGEEFKVVSALSGKVSAVRQDALLGNVIEIEHEKGLMTVYQSVKDIQVKAGDSVKQGEVLATSSTSQFNKEVNNHVHFEIRKDSKAVNPMTYFGEPASAIESADENAEVSDEDESKATSEEDNSDQLDQ